MDKLSTLTIFAQWLATNSPDQLVRAKALQLTAAFATLDLLTPGWQALVPIAETGQIPKAGDLSLDLPELDLAHAQSLVNQLTSKNHAQPN